MKNDDFFKGAGVLMILGGIIAIITGIAMIPMAASLSDGGDVGMMFAAALLSIACGIVAIAAGRAGAGKNAKLEKISNCAWWAAVACALGLAGNVLASTVTGSINIVNATLSILFPILYIMGAKAACRTVRASAAK